jgi:hypothetical protein
LIVSPAGCLSCSFFCPSRVSEQDGRSEREGCSSKVGYQGEGGVHLKLSKLSSREGVWPFRKKFLPHTAWVEDQRKFRGDGETQQLPVGAELVKKQAYPPSQKKPRSSLTGLLLLEHRAFHLSPFTRPSSENPGILRILIEFFRANQVTG